MIGICSLIITIGAANIFKFRTRMKNGEKMEKKCCNGSYLSNRSLQFIVSKVFDDWSAKNHPCNPVLPTILCYFKRQSIYSRVYRQKLGSISDGNSNIQGRVWHFPIFHFRNFARTLPIFLSVLLWQYLVNAPQAETQAQFSETVVSRKLVFRELYLEWFIIGCRSLVAGNSTTVPKAAC